MYKILFTLIAVVLLVSTFGISALKPKMHKNVIIYSSEYKIVQPKVETTVVRNIPTQTNDKPVTKTLKSEEPVYVKTETVKQPKQSTKLVKKETKKVQQPAKKVNTQKVATQKTTTVKKQEPAKKVVQETQKTTPVKQEVKKVEVQPVKKVEVLTQQQETIMWNKWRSDLQNQIMRDVKLPIMPNGVIFKFKFDVDKYGRVTNVQTWSTTPAYTPYAIQYIAPVIRSYQGRSILNFPEGSNRMNTVVEGGWKISQTAKYSTPSDYKDTETINK